jgi:hypothetical protein
LGFFSGQQEPMFGCGTVGHFDNHRPAGTHFEVNGGRRRIPGLEIADFDRIQLRVNIQFLERLTDDRPGFQVADFNSAGLVRPRRGCACNDYYEAEEDP